MKSFLTSLRNHARITPERAALVYGDQSRSYAQLDAASSAVAALLRKRGIQPGDIVPVLLPRGFDVLVAAMGILKAGAAFTIINTAYPKERIDFVISDTGGIPPVDEAFMADCEGMTGEPAADPRAEDPALVVYTSGSTGNPKGVVNSWRALGLALEVAVCGRTAEDVFLSTFTYSFVGIVVDALVALYLGATLHIASDAIRRDAGALVEYAKRHGITTAALSPLLLAQALARGDMPMRSILTGSEKVSMLFSDTTRLYCVYGASETCGPFTAFPIDKPYASTPCGLPGKGSAVYILDDEGNALPAGVKGEICVSGQIASGYLNLPELTREKFIPNPFAEGGQDDRLFRTGDLGLLREDGVLEYVQRKDWMLKVRGFRVEPGEIEAAIVGRTPARQAVVVGFENACGQTSLYAVYTADEPLPAKAVEDAIRGFLPDYMLPAFMEQVDALPLNVNGKIDRKSISPPDAQRFVASYEPPASPREARLCAAFARMLGLEKVGALDDFVLLGGDSISAVRLQTLVPETAVAQVLTLRTPRALAQMAGDEAALPPAPARAFWPLTDAERQMAAEYALRPGSLAYNIENTITLRGDVDPRRWERALRELVSRHRILRSCYPMRDSEHTHVVRDDMPVELTRIACAPEEAEGHIKALNLPYNLEEGPLFRFALMETGPDTGVLLLGFHHILLDGSCIEILLKDLEDLYNAKPLPPPGPDLLDWAVWREEHPRGPESEQFFKEMFKDGLPEIDMPTRPIRPEAQPVGDRTVFWALPAKPMDDAARRYGVTAYTLMMAVVGMVLGKYTAGEDVVLGTAMSGRVAACSRSIVGMFANTVVARLKPAGAARFDEYLAEVDRVLGGVKRHQDYPFHKLVQALGVERTAARNPVYDMMVNYISRMPDIHVEGVEATYRHLSSQRLPVDLQLEIFREQDSMRFELSYAEALYLPEVPENMAEQLKISLARVCENGNLLVMDAAELPDGQRRRILEDFAAPVNGEAGNLTVVEQFRAQARRAPNRPAVRHAETLLDYAALDDVTDRLAAELARRGLGRGDCVGVLVDRSEMMPVGGLGVLKSGAAYLPLDPSYPADRLEFMLKDAGVRLVIADEGLRGAIPGYDGEFLSSEAVRSLPAAANVPDGPGIEDLFVVLYTSGTTGNPKGVGLCHDNLAHLCAWYRRYYGVTEADSVAAYASFGFDACLMDMYPALTAGALIHIIPQNMRLDVDRMNDYFNEHGVTLAFMTTQLGRQFAEGMVNHSLRHLSTGGEALVPIGPGKTYAFHNLYGPTECTVITSAFPIDGLYDRVPIGKPIDNMRAYVMDKHGRLAPVCVPGELGIAGRGVARGYLGRPDVTREKFVPNPYTDEAGYGRIYKSGDVVRFLPDGNLDFVGRRDFQVKIRGFRVELAEIEGRIRAYPQVKDAAVVPMDAPGGGKCAVAYVVADGPLDIAALNRFVEEKLPPYMVPAATVPVERIPLNPNGKVDRRKLPAPSFAGSEEAGKSDAPAPTDLGRDIFEVARTVLGHDQFGPSTNLLHAGLASLSAIKLCTLLKKRFGAAPDVQRLLANPTLLFIENSIVRQLLERVAEPQNAPPAAEHSGDGEAGYPLSGSQMGVYLDSQKDPAALMYNIPSRVVLPACVDANRLADAVETVLAAHPGLRVRIEDTADGILQILTSDAVRVERLMLSQEELDAYARAFARPFDLATGPLYRAAVATGPDSIELFTDFHHIAFDGASMDLFLREVGEAYDGNAPAAEEMPGYAYGRWEEQQEQGGAWQAHKDYFDELLKDLESASEISADLPGKSGGRLAQYDIPVDRSAAEAFCRRRGFTLAGLFLAATTYAVGRWTGSRNVGLSTISSGRGDIRLQNSTGMFVRTLPLVVGMKEGQTAADYVGAAQASLRGSVAHEVYPYTRIAQEHGFKPSIMYACELGVLADYEIGGHKARFDALNADEPKFKISVHVEERGRDTVFSVQYDDALYSPQLMERFAQTLAAAFAAMIARPDALVSGISLLSDQQAALLESFRPSRLDPLPCGTLHGMFERAADRTPEATALIACEARYSYAQLDEEANRIANALLDMGLASEDRVAFMLPRTGRILMTMLGILKAGGAYVPLDPEYPRARVEQILADSEAKFLVSTEERLGDYQVCVDVDALRGHPNAGRPRVEVAPNRLAYLIYTSGSTGKPKGVMIEHLGIANYLTPDPANRHIHALVQDAKCMLSITTVTFDMFLKESMAALCNGLTLVFADEEAARDPVRLAELFEKTGADAFNATPSRMMEYTTYPALLQAIRRCRVVMAGAEKYPAALMERLRGGEAHKLRLFNTYGPTEITVSCNAKELTNATRVTIGAPLLGVVEAVMDLDGNELPTLVVGELWIGGRGVARGYVNLPEQTAERFVVRNGVRMYRSGDMARWTPDGEIEILGRNDKQIKLRGLRIELGEVEAALLSIPGVKNGAVVIHTVQGAERLCAYYTAERLLDPVRLQAEMAGVLAPYMVPGAWLQLSAFPQTANGKIDYKNLPEPKALRLQEYVPPATASEERLSSIFAQVLGLEPNEVGALDSFFDLGGTSLSVTRVVVALKEAGLHSARGEGISFGDVFQNPTPRALAALITRGESGENPNEFADSYDYRAIDAILRDNALDAFRREPSRPLDGILLTGATGFLGIHILERLLRDRDAGTIYCLMRRGRYANSEQRLKQLLFYYFENAYAELFGSRIIPVEGDVTDPGAFSHLKGASIRTVVNCAANVTHFAKDDSIFRTNTVGVERLIDLCLATGARLIQISTASVSGFSVDGRPGPEEKLTEQRLYLGQNMENQYVYSKFLAERALLEACATRGLDGKIMRVGNLMARNSDGEFQMNAAANSFLGRLRAYSVIGCFPYSAYLSPTAMAPIDSTAEAVLLLARTPRECRVFQPYNDHSIFLGDIIMIMREEGIPVELVEDDVFQKALTEALNDPDRAEYLTSLVAYQGIAKGQCVSSVPLDNRYTTQVLLRMGWRWPITGNEYLRKFLRDMITLGFFERPSLSKSVRG
ncbi:MAG: amino acid adenylation domain-containing protein [Christensenellaceae bacterium]|nr:amino acid adenylation domain-containing protein [Christensenellaceae bacterium]